jgi:RNA polymerase sigma-70 factor (ECF subfamily)
LDPFQRDLVALLPRLRRFARSLTGQAWDADDLVQVTIERALTRRAQWRPDTNLGAWMFKIMKNAWIDEARSRARRSRSSGPQSEAEAAPDPLAPDMNARLAASAVERAMSDLPDDQRIAVCLVLVEGLSYREAAEVLEIPEGTLTSRLVRGRMALMAKLEGLGA